MAGKPSIVTDENIELAVRLLDLGKRKSIIKVLLRAAIIKSHQEKTVQSGQKDGKRRDLRVSARSLETILSRARDRIVEEEGVSRRDQRIKSRRFYENIKADEEVPAKDRIRAQENIDKLLGLQIHRVIHTGTGEGGAIKTETQTTVSLKGLSDEELLALETMAKKAKGGGG